MIYNIIRSIILSPFIIASIVVCMPIACIIGLFISEDYEEYCEFIYGAFYFFIPWGE